MNEILTIIFSVSCGFALLEYVFQIHVQTILEYAKYNLDFNDILPSGNYQLSWTFERQGVLPRYGSFFAYNTFEIKLASPIGKIVNISIISIKKKNNLSKKVKFHFFL